ncbi:unnamed protein product [Caenorhabditis nigoni]
MAPFNDLQKKMAVESGEEQKNNRSFISIERKRKSEDAENGTPPKQQSLDSKRGSALDGKQKLQGPSSWD